MEMTGRIKFSTTARHLLLTAPVLVGIFTALPAPANAQKTPTPQNTQGSETPQAPGGPQDTGRPVVIKEGETVSTLSGAQTHVFSTVLHRDPSDPEHATDPLTGRNFHWDPTTNTWVDSQTGQSFPVSGYLCSTPGPSALPTPGTTGTAPPSPTPEENKRVALQFRGFGGATIINSNSPSTAGFDGAVLFPLGNRVLVGPTAGFQWVDSSIVKTIGGGPPPSTFIHTSVGFKTGNFGGRIAFPFGGWQVGIHGGATVAGSTITQAEGFCGNGTPTGGPAGCTVTSSTTTHDTVVGPFVGGYISHSIFSHVGVFVEYDYHHLKETKSSVSVFDLHDSDVVAGIVLSFGRHKAK